MYVLYELLAYLIGFSAYVSDMFADV